MSDKPIDKKLAAKNPKDASQTNLSFQHNEVDHDKRKFLVMATAGVGAVGAAAVAVPFIASMLPSERAKAAGAPVEVDVSKIASGAMMIAEWRGKPVWVINRTPEMIAELSKPENLQKLSDPQCDVTSQQPSYCKNANRSVDDKNLAVIVGICTHLGCSPTPKMAMKGDMGDNWTGGFFCPCHGSKFDLAGRVIKGSPAPINLVIPPYKYLDDNTIVIGEDATDDKKAAA